MKKRKKFVAGAVLAAFSLFALSAVFGGCAGRDGDTSSSDPEELYLERFKGKKWLVIGDSISEINETADKNYSATVGEMLGAEVINMATSGSGFINPLEGPLHRNCWLERLRHGDYPVDIDFITVMGAVNDYGYPLGEHGGTDEGTVLGASGMFFSLLLEKYPGVPVVFITDPPSGTMNRGVYDGAIMKTARDLGIPALNLLEKSRIRYDTQEMKDKYYYKSDAVHPNQAGHDEISPYIYEFLLEEVGPRLK